MIRTLLLLLLVSVPCAAHAITPPAGAVRYCVTPLFPMPVGLWVRALIDVAPEDAALHKGEQVWLRFGSAAEARDGARGACWWLVKTPAVAGKPNARRVIGYAP